MLTLNDNALTHRKPIPALGEPSEARSFSALKV